MSRNDKRADEIIEETMRELYDDIEKSKVRDTVDEPEYEDEDAYQEYEDGEDYQTYEEYDDDDDDVSETADKGRKRHKRKKKAGKVIGILVGILIVIYAGFAFYFSNHFMFNTKINGNKVALKNVSQVESRFKKEVDNYTLTLKESDGDKEVIEGSDISLEYVQTDELKKCVKKQNNYLWITSLWDHPTIEAEIGVKYDEDELSEELKDLDCMDKKNQVRSKNAYPKFVDTKFEVQPEVIGTEINDKKFNEAVAEALDGFIEELDLKEAGCYIAPKYTKDSAKVKKAAEKMNSYLGAKITYKMSPKTEVVDSSVISEWVKVDKKMNVTFDKEEVKAYIQKLANKYNTRGKTRTIKTATGKRVKVSGGDYGWCIAQDSEYAELIKDIESGKEVKREPKYLSKAASHGSQDVGDTYAEVDLTNQRAYFIKNGEVVLKSDVVTGNPNLGHETPPGVYSLTYKTKDAVLRGERKADGTYSYEAPVKYWMPFNGGIGFHDASWQPTFGGSWYKGHGSHGCVNMPTSAAAKMYDLVYTGVPVVCHN